LKIGSERCVTGLFYLVELLDLTFASRTGGFAGSECRIRSTSVWSK
jgi:hypothetical protein